MNDMQEYNNDCHQELREQGWRNLALISEAAVRDVLGDDFEYEPLYPAKSNWIDLEDIPDVLDLEDLYVRPTEEAALPACDSWIIRRNHVNNVGTKLMREADERYAKAVKQILEDLPACTTREQVDRAVACFGKHWEACVNATGMAYDSWPTAVEDAVHDADKRIYARGLKQAQQWALYQEKQRRAAYVASHKEVVFKFNKEVVSA